MQPAIHRPSRSIETLVPGGDRRDLVTSETWEGNQPVPAGRDRGCRDSSGEVVEDEFASREPQRLAREVEDGGDHPVGGGGRRRIARVGVDMPGEEAARPLNTDLRLNVREIEGGYASARAELVEPVCNGLEEGSFAGSKPGLVNPELAQGGIMAVPRVAAENLQLQRVRVGLYVPLDCGERVVGQEAIDDHEPGT